MNSRLIIIKIKTHLISYLSNPIYNKMEHINTAIKNTSKNNLIAITCAATLVAPYIFKFVSGIVCNGLRK